MKVRGKRYQVTMYIISDETDIFRYTFIRYTFTDTFTDTFET